MPLAVQEINDTVHIGSNQQKPSTNEPSLIIAERGIKAIAEKAQIKSANYTMTAADSGMVTYVDTDAITITLPSTVVGYTYTFVNAGADAAVALTVSPAAADKIVGCGLTAADNKDLVNTKATARTGDRLTIIGDGVDGWYIQEMSGVWAREA